ncbi:hypothetical protein ACK8HY_20465 [Sphingobacterium sp. NGMCC 1.201703]|uniref:hypothetical protein n=1 Tax=Sphingobacterium sp. NGMCC 1.201703 TaxID=3388657 RepID=UPI0039FC58DF
MKRIIAIIAAICLLISCKKSNTEPEVEVIQKGIELETLVPESLGSQGTKLLGRILALNSEKITEHGFMLITSKGLGAADTTWLKIIDQPVAGNNSLLIKNLTIPPSGQAFRLQYYVQTKDKKYWANTTEFLPTPIKVKALADSKVTIGQQLTVTGDFAKIDDTFRIYMRSQSSIAADPVPYTLNANKTSISFAVPHNLKHGNEIDFILADNRFMSSFLAKVSVIGTLSPPETYEFNYSDIIRFYGQGLSSNTDAPFQIIIGNKVLPYSVEYHLSDLLSGQRGKEFRIGYFNGADTIIFPKKIKLNIPSESAFQFYNTFAHPGSTLRVDAANLDQYLPLSWDKSKVNLAGKIAQLQILWGQDDNLTIGNVAEGSYPIEILTDLYNYTSTQKLRVEKLKPTGISTGPVEPMALIKVFGNFMEGQRYTVVEKNGYTYDNIARNGSLEVYAVSNTKEFQIVKIGYSSDWNPPTWIDTDLKVAIKSTTFTGISPLSGNYSTKISLQGQGLRGATVHIGENVLFPSIDDYGNAYLYMPMYILPGKYKISIFQNGEWFTSEQFFELKY